MVVKQEVCAIGETVADVSRIVCEIFPKVERKFGNRHVSTCLHD